MDAVIALIVGLVLGESNIVSVVLITIAVALGIYIVLMLVFSFFIVPFQEHTKLEKTISGYKKKSKEPPEIVKLAEYRTNGVALRNSGERLSDLRSLHEWINGYTEWDKNVLSTLAKLSKVQAEWYRTLDRMPVQLDRKVLDQEHLRYLSIFDEKLKRLDIILRQYLNL